MVSKMNFEEFVEFYNSPKYREWLDAEKDKCLHCVHRKVCITRNDQQVRDSMIRGFCYCRKFESEILPRPNADYRVSPMTVTPVFLTETPNTPQYGMEGEANIQYPVVPKRLGSSSAYSSGKTSQKK